MTRDEQIMLFYDGELDEAAEAEARALLESDAEARALLARLELVSSVVKEVGDAAPTPSDITSAVMARVLGEPAPMRAPAPVVPLAPQRGRTKRALGTVAASLALAAGLALLLSRRDESGSTARTAPVVAAPAGAISAPEPDPPEQSVAIERIDFGEDPGAIFLVPGVDDRTIVVWTMDAATDNGPEIEL
jgi:anti-sigma factor RsiW